jgi:hypothetical protein
MLNLLFAMRWGANSISGTAGDAPVVRHGIEAAPNERFALGDTTAAGKAQTEGQSGFQMVLGRAAGAGSAIYL